jgi:sodium/bile acid cotransporter 7
LRHLSPPFSHFSLIFRHFFAAQVAKTGGLIRAEYSIKYGAVVVIFLLSGAGLKTSVLLSAAASWRIHLMTQTLSLVVTPAIGYGVASGLWRTSLNADLVSGLVVCLSTSTTASTNVVFTKAAGGNEALALVNAVLGNLIGIFLTPAWLTTYLSATGHVPYGRVIKQLVSTIVAPLIAGNIVQYLFPARVAAAQKVVNFNKIGSAMVLLLVWSTFSNTFAKHVKVDPGSVIAMTLILLGLYLTFTAGALALVVARPLRRCLRASDRDAIAVAMCAGTKTVALGIPIIQAVYADNKAAGLLSLPLIIYHAEQILFGSLLTAPLARWAARREAAAEGEAGKGQEGAEGAEGGGSSGSGSSGSRRELCAVTVDAGGSAGDGSGSGAAVEPAAQQ